MLTYYLLAQIAKSDPRTFQNLLTRTDDGSFAFLLSSTFWFNLCIPNWIALLKAGMHIYARAAAKGKRIQVTSCIFSPVKFLPSISKRPMSICYIISAQSNMGAKNHGLVLPDANIDATLNALLAAGFGAAGQRCMALSTVVFVGNSKSWYC